MTCNQNCTQGRACDCAPDVDEDAPMTRLDLLLLFLAGVLSGATSCLILVGIGATLGVWR